MIGDHYFLDKRSVPRAFYETAKLTAVEDKGNGIWKFI